MKTLSISVSSILLVCILFLTTSSTTYYYNSVMVVNAATATTTNSIDWTAVPTTAPDTTNFNTETVGNCMCDLTPGICDANCCCDADCSSTAFFTSCDRANGGNNQKLECTPETTSILRSTQETERKLVYGEYSVCVTRTNLAGRDGLDLYYALPDDSSRAALAAPTDSWPSSSAATTTTATTTSFSVGDLLPIVHSVLVGTTYSLAIPPSKKYFKDFGATSSPSGVCDSDSVLGFMQDGDASSSYTHTCSLSDTLATVCAAGGSLNLDQFRWLAFTPPHHNYAGVTSLVPISLRIVDDSTGLVLETLDASHAFTEAFAAGTATVPTATVATTFDGTNCLNAVASTRLTVQYSSTTTGLTSISSASLVVRVTPVRAPLATNLYPISSSVRFVVSGSAASLLSNDGPITSEATRSGNPGYIQGRAVIAGYSTTDSATSKTAVYQLPRGFEIPIGGSDTCTTARFGSVPFLHNVETSSCTLSITEANLQSFCTTGTLTQLEAILAPTTCGTAACPTTISKIVDRIGIDGLASYTDSNDWISVQGLPITNPTNLAYDSVRDRCSGIITGLKWTFGVARAGPVFNPQDVIVSAKVEPIIGSWTFAPNPTASATASVRFTFKVAFVRMPESSQYIRKPIVPPSLFPAVDEDVLYPFKRPDS